MNVVCLKDSHGERTEALLIISQLSVNWCRLFTVSLSVAAKTCVKTRLENQRDGFPMNHSNPCSLIHKNTVLQYIGFVSSSTGVNSEFISVPWAVWEIILNKMWLMIIIILIWKAIIIILFQMAVNQQWENWVLNYFKEPLWVKGE